MDDPQARLAHLVANRYEGRFYDGKTSAAHPAWLWLQDDGLRICYQEVPGKVNETFWPVVNILRDEFSSQTMVVLRFDSAPVEKIEVADPSFLHALEAAYRGATFLRHPYKDIAGAGLWKKAGWVALGGGVLYALQQYVLPLLGF